MKRFTFSILSALALIGAGCEQHPASELEGEGGEAPHAAEPAKPAESVAPAAEAAPKPAEPANPGTAPKFFPDSAK
jgi:hypothetical protein